MTFSRDADGTISLAVVNAKVWTGDVRKPWADAVAARGDRIAIVGSSAEVRKAITVQTHVIDAQGAMVVPGFIDSHVHFLQGGLALGAVQLRDANTRDEYVRRIEAFARAAAPGSWVQRGDWDHELWGGELPTRAWIDDVTPRNPVWINRLDGHMALANSAALERAGISRDTPDIEGGTIVRDSSGNPTGILKDNAMQLVAKVMPEHSDADWDDALQSAMRYVARQGVTSVHNMGTWAELDIFKRARQLNKLQTRIYAAVPLPDWERLRDTILRDGRGDNWLSIGGLKAFVDGSLGSYTAAMFDAYEDEPENRGLLMHDTDQLFAWMRDADAAGMQNIVHAIGDRANNIQLNLIERIIATNAPRDRRFRIEHAQHLEAGDIARFGELDVIASVQPYHAIDDGRWAERAIGSERASRTYAFNSLQGSGATLAFGSDWFVAPPKPLLGIYAAVTRRTLDGLNPDGWIPAQKITVHQSLRAYTMGAATAGFQEREMGSIAVGKLADFVLIDRDLTRIAADEIRDAAVLLTIIGGHVIFDAATERSP
ncbi:MAG: amidohydrolase [Gemmatimonadota bacterium]|nr:amidohydrolase [Gemmatimonadota bacterium]